MGWTDCAPPLACRVYELPSVPVTVTRVEFVAVTVNIDELPDGIEARLAVILTVGTAGSGFELIAPAPPHPVTRRRIDASAAGQILLKMKKGRRMFTISVFFRVREDNNRTISRAADGCRAKKNICCIFLMKASTARNGIMAFFEHCGL